MAQDQTQPFPSIHYSCFCIHCLLWVYEGYQASTQSCYVILQWLFMYHSCPLAFDIMLAFQCHNPFYLVPLADQIEFSFTFFAQHHAPQLIELIFVTHFIQISTRPICEAIILLSTFAKVILILRYMADTEYSGFCFPRTH